jgi:hypothetical protein
MDHYKEKCFLNTTSKIEGDNFAFLCMMKLLPLEIKNHICYSNSSTLNVVTLDLGLRPRQGLARLQTKRKARESCHMLPRMQESVREYTLPLPRELPFWELESRWTFKCLESDCKGQNPMD